MRLVGAGEIEGVLSYPDLIPALADAFRGKTTAPPRHHHAIPQDGGDATLLLMPAWTVGDRAYAGVKVVSVFPRNAELGRPSVTGAYLLLSGQTGEPLACLDAASLTGWRTAAASALAASYLAAPDARRMVMVGAGALAPRLIAAHLSVRPIAEVAIWNRTPEHAEKLAARLTRPDVPVRATRDLATAVAEADIVSVATMSADPLVRGAWLKAGTHVDLVGGYRPGMREADDDAVRRATVFVDTRAGALEEAGDIVQPIAAGVLAADGIAGELADLCGGRHPGRRSASEITLFKSVGAAIEDLAAAVLVYERL